MNTHELDFDRKSRLGFPEVIYGATKSADVLLDILIQYKQNGENALITKLQRDKAEILLNAYPKAHYDKLSGAFMLSYNKDMLQTSKVAILSAGTSDMYITNEVYYTLAYLGLEAERINDIGISGIHRILNRVDELKKFEVLIVAAGFEGALPTVVGGLLPQPIIAVPTSIGYGVAEKGLAALSTMLSSCANGITVVNIDNGYGAAMAAFRIVNQKNRS